MNFFACIYVLLLRVLINADGPAHDLALLDKTGSSTSNSGYLYESVHSLHSCHGPIILQEVQPHGILLVHVQPDMYVQCSGVLRVQPCGFFHGPMIFMVRGFFSLPT